MRLKTAATLLAHAGVGWALCGLTMGIGLVVTSLGAALIVHAIAAPVYFALIAWVYFRRFHRTGPLATAAAFTAIVVFLDVVVVALLMQRSFAMFSSLLGTWVPFVLIFLATWLTGRVAAKAA
jgi:hypothetical protein